MVDQTFPNRPPLPVGSIGLHSAGFTGMALLILSEASVFAYLFFAYFYFSVQPHSGAWPPSGPPSFKYSALQAGIMLIGCATAWWANRSAARGARPAVLLALGLSLLLALSFIALQFADWYDKPYSLASDAASSFYFVITGVHLAHVVAGALMIAAVLVWSALGYFGPVRHVPILVTAFYWYFLAVAYLWLFFTLYGTPRLA
ncbi:MAG: cytochrome c oxidase subunit 3 [Alphaproteobacteria bacterium]|nr:cytochrome c oxidase subunit 3 [Alphaproteobacteria bacterium]